MNAIEIKGLCKNFGKKVAVDNIDLDVREGELFGLLGVNGAGKTTTIRMLCCLSRPDSGDAKVCGYSIVNNSTDVKSVIGISPQETSVAPNLTVRENFEFMAGVWGADRAAARQKADEMIARFDMQSVQNNRAKTLSGGWQRRLSIAMALIGQPRVLFLDEPTLGLDVLARRELWNHIQSMKGNITMVLTTHYLEEIEALCDRVAIMVNGKVYAVGTVDELKNTTATDSLEDAFVKISQQNGGAV